MQQRVKSRSRAARAEVVAPELLAQLDVAVHDAAAALDMRLGGIGVPPLTRDGESRGGRRGRDVCAWQPPMGVDGAALLSRRVKSGRVVPPPPSGHERLVSPSLR